MSYTGFGAGRQLGFVEVVEMLSVRYDTVTEKDRAFPQKGLWIYERKPQIKRYYKREYPEFFAPKTDKAAARVRREKQAQAPRVVRERRSTTTESINRKIQRLRSTPVDISTYRARANA